MMVTPQRAKRPRAASYLAVEEDVDWSISTQQKIKDALTALNTHARLLQVKEAKDSSTTSPQNDPFASGYQLPGFLLKKRAAPPGLAYSPPAIEPEPARIATITSMVKSLDTKTLQDLMISVIAHDHTNVTASMLCDAKEQASRRIDVESSAVVDLGPVAETTHTDIFDKWVQEVRGIHRAYEEEYPWCDGDPEWGPPTSKEAAKDIRRCVSQIRTQCHDTSSYDDKLDALWALQEICEIVCWAESQLRGEFSNEEVLPAAIYDIASSMCREEHIRAACSTRRTSDGAVATLYNRLSVMHEDWYEREVGFLEGQHLLEATRDLFGFSGL